MQFSWGEDSQTPLHGPELRQLMLVGAFQPWASEVTWQHLEVGSAGTPLGWMQNLRPILMCGVGIKKSSQEVIRRRVLGCV